MHTKLVVYSTFSSPNKTSLFQCQLYASLFAKTLLAKGGRSDLTIFKTSISRYSVRVPSGVPMFRDVFHYRLRRAVWQLECYKRLFSFTKLDAAVRENGEVNTKDGFGRTVVTS